MASSPAGIQGEIVVLAKMYPKAGTGPQVLEWIDKLTASAKNEEPGTLEYSWAQNGDEILIWERYTSAAGITAHCETETFKAFVAADLLKVPPTLTFYPGKVTGGL